MTTDSKWENIQNDINTCSCRTDTQFVQTVSIPARPPSSFTEKPLLLISEAPPETGGFWQLRVDDSLRSNVLQLLRAKGLQIPANSNSREALDSFLAGGFFLVQTLKWPLANGKTYNNLGPAQKRQLTQHAALRHLQNEIMALAPKGIYAMGNAAWDACRRFSVGLPAGGVETARGKKGLFISLSQREIPINVSILPTAYNFNTRLSMVLEDFTDFLDRHHWQLQ